MDRLRNACDQRVSVLATDDYVAVSPYTPLSQAIEAMKNDEGGCVIISDDGRVAGIFTERDLLTKVLGETVDFESPISDWMQPQVATLSFEATIGEAVRLMNEKSFRNVPLMKNGFRHHYLPGRVLSESDDEPAATAGAGDGHPGRRIEI